MKYLNREIAIGILVIVMAQSLPNLWLRIAQSLAGASLIVIGVLIQILK